MAHAAPAITVRLTGGLGNQMFEYATGRAMADRTGLPLVLDPTRLAYPGRHETRRSVIVTSFRIEGTLAEAEQHHWRRFLGYSPVAVRVRGALPGEVLTDRHPYAVDERIQARTTRATLDGYWQCEEYFAHIKEHLKEEFTPTEQPGVAWTALASTIRSSESVGIHIRRGDYVTNRRANAHHGVSGVDYVRRAWETVAPSPEARTFIFSDDPGWCRENLSFLPFPVFVDGNRDFEDLLLLSKCRHKIITNSSFGWWAAWLGERPDGMIVAPRAWLRGGTDVGPSPVPKRWTRR